MSDNRSCPECGAPLAQDLVFGVCPACVLRGALTLSSGMVEAAIAEQPGQFIGPYKLIKRIGEGGYGVVYRAEQEKPIHRFVALKIIKLGMDTRQVIARFEAERQALAMMDHPSIAKVFEAGSSETGRPYFVMELVDGVKITDYCNESNLSTRERLGLFVQVCRAVQHAHQKGIIHRDLKPSNILVAMHDGTPVPKVIDFGIAKATEQRLTDDTLFTAMGEFIGTPAYMSPEQAGMAGMDVDTRSDIYALGVLLYELLTGHTPFERTDLLKAGLDEMCRVIRDQEPPKPSTKLGTLTAADLTKVARNHRTEPPRLLHGVRGDLDWIAMKCLEKDRARRYETASGLALDVERHLNHEPVAAAAPGHWYRLQKFVRRHRIGLAMTCSLALLLIAGIVVSTWLAVRARKAEREQAHLRGLAEMAEKTSLTEATKSREVAKFLQDMLEGVGPSVALGRDTTLLREILDKTAGRVGKELQDHPDVEAALLTTIGNVYDAIGDDDKALALHQEALRLRKTFFGDENPGVADSLNNLAVVLLAQGKLADSEKLFRQALDMRRKVLTNGHPDIALSLNNLGAVLDGEGKYDEAEPLCRESLAMNRKLYAKEQEDVATSMFSLGNVLYHKNLTHEAEAMFRDVETMRRKLFGNQNLDLATTIANLGSVLSAEGRYKEAEGKFREALAMQRRLRGRDHKDIASLLYSLSTALNNEGKWAEAEGFCRDAIAMQRQLLGPDHVDLAASLAGFSSIVLPEGKFAEAEAAQREALDIQRKANGDESPAIAISLLNLGDVLRAEGRFAEAETEARHSLAMMQKFVPGTNQYVAYCLATLANVFRDEGKLAEAEATERQTLTMRTNSLGPEHPEVAQSLNDLGVILAAEGSAGVPPASSGGVPPPATNPDPRLKEAESLLSQALAMRQKLLGDEHPDTLDSRNTLAAVLQKRGKLTEAEPLARECLSHYEKLLPDDWRAFDTRSLLGGILLARANYIDAEPLLLSGYAGLKQRYDKIPAGNRHRLKETAAQLVQLYTATAQPAKAAEWKGTASQH